MNLKVRLVIYGICLASFIVFSAAVRWTYQGKAIAWRGILGTNVPVAADTNAGTAGTSTNLTASNAPAASVPAADEEFERRNTVPMGRVMIFGGIAFLSLVVLSLLAANDVSRFIANRADAFLFNDDLKGVKDPEYEEAEEAWTNGHHLDAVRLLREYYQKRPREIHASLRIAEIYEKDLGNNLAAALEYEEVLKKRLPAERWGWAAIHLANLYSGKLNKSAEAEKLLRRIIDEYGKTAAAKKARDRLGIPETIVAEPPPEPVEVAAPRRSVPIKVTVVKAPSEPEPEPEAKPPDRPKLPPGFRPKK